MVKTGRGLLIVATAVLFLTTMSGTIMALVTDTTIPTVGTINYGLSYLHTEGKLIKDEAGRTVYLRGVAKMCMEFSADAHGYHVTETDFENIKNLLNPNVVRIDLALSLLFPTFDMSAPDSTYLGLMDNIVKWCGDRDMYVLFDLHGYYPQMSAPTDFWTEPWWEERGIREPYRSHIRDFWVFIANRYKGNPTVFGFDLFNEPWNAVVKPPPDDRPTPKEWKTMVHEWIDAITAVNPKLLFIVENAGHQMWGHEDWRWIAPGGHEGVTAIDRPNVVYSPHFYPQRLDGTWVDDTWIPLAGNTYAGDYAAGNYEVAKANMETFLTALWQEGADYPFMVTEFGFCGDEAGLQCLKDILDFFNRHGYSYTYWGWYHVPPGESSIWNHWLVETDWVTLTPQGEILAECLASVL